MNESKNQSRPLALITGASAGIGAEYARQMAAAGYYVALTARRRERLDELAAELSADHGIECLVIAADLAEADAPASIMAEIEASGRQVTVLVNNAGYAIGGFLNQADWDEHRQFLQVMVNAVTELCHRCLPGIREQNTGGIINVASLAGIVPGSSGHTLYAAVKAYMIKLSESLAMENTDRRICIQAICPGFYLLGVPRRGRHPRHRLENARLHVDECRRSGCHQPAGVRQPQSAGHAGAGPLESFRRHADAKAALPGIFCVDEEA